MNNILVDQGLKEAVCGAFNEEYDYINSSEAKEYRYDFSNKADAGLKDLLRITDHRYVHFGKGMIRRSLAAALIAVMILCSCGMVYAVGNAIVNWTVSKGDLSSENWSVWFETDNPEEWDFERVVYQPQAPAELTVKSENLTKEDIPTYEVSYQTEDGNEVVYREILGITDGYFGIKVTQNNVEEVKIGENSGQHFYDDSGYNVLMWTDGYSLFTIEGLYDYSNMIMMAKSLVVKEVLG